MPDAISALRSEIDATDKRIIDALNERMRLAHKIGRCKAQLSREVLDEAREKEVITKLRRINEGPLLNDALTAIYREIFSGSRALQSPQRVAFLGPKGTYSYEAVIERFGHSVQLAPCSSISDIFEEMKQDTQTLGVAPIENSIEGSVRETLDQLMISDTLIVGEIALRIAHALMSVSGRVDDIEMVMSHPQALAQCRARLQRLLPGIPLVETSSTAKASEEALANPDVAAIGSERYGTTLGLRMVRRGVQDLEGNITRFVQLGRFVPAPTGADKTSIVFWTENKPGALFHALEKFAENKINLSRIESRPDRGAMAWKYAFFVDLEGHREDSAVAGCLEEISDSVTKLKLLGSYPAQESPISANG